MTGKRLYTALNVLLLCIVLCLAGGLWVGQKINNVGDTPVSDVAVFHVEKGQSITAITRTLLQQDGLTVYQRLWLKLHASTFAPQFGYYAIEQRNLSNALAHVSRGPQVQIPITIVEGHTLHQWIASLATTPYIYNDVTTGSDTYRYLIDGDVFMEGNVLADTYYVDVNTPVSEIIMRASRALNAYLNEQISQYGLPQPLASAKEVLVLASMVEKETGVAQERPLIAGVFLNRLRQGMRLQSDPTIIYGIGPNFNGDITRRDISTKTLYNTYTIPGLPPTPIAIVGRDSINAVLKPVDTEYLFFVAKGKGFHHFSKTYDEHKAAVQRFILNR